MWRNNSFICFTFCLLKVTILLSLIVSAFPQLFETNLAKQLIFPFIFFPFLVTLNKTTALSNQLDF